VPRRLAPLDGVGFRRAKPGFARRLTPLRR
jgi:hypothetical protein